jgi:acyl-CoA thioesterase-1
MMKTLYAFVCSLAVSLLLISGEVVATEKAVAETHDKIKVLVWGDSLSAAYGIPVDKGWVSLLQEQYKDELDVVNASISGETTQGGLSRLPDALERHKPTLLLLELGANDGLRGIQTETMQENLQKMIVMSQEAGAKAALLGIRIPLNYGFTYTQKFEKVYVDLAEKYDLPLLPFLLETVALDYDLMQSDGLHPTADAQPKVLEHVMTMLKSVLEGMLSEVEDSSKAVKQKEIVEKSEAAAAVTN